MKRCRIIIEAVLLMVILQLVRELLEWIVHPLIIDVSFYHRMTTMIVMIVLSGIVIRYAHLRDTALCVFPDKFNRRYIICSCIAFALLLSTPSNYTGGYQAILLLIYGSIVTPIYEELIFRGYLWNRLNSAFLNEKDTYLWSIVLFGIWHLGYVMPQFMEGNLSAVFWKFIAGVGYGIVLGAVRLKTKNCYSTMLVHGVLNIFMI